MYFDRGGKVKIALTIIKIWIFFVFEDCNILYFMRQSGSLTWTVKTWLTIISGITKTGEVH